jgi:glycosyltransferase involved in cell wall biosynthesis
VSAATSSADYWESRFETGDWDAHGGPAQTRFFTRLALAAAPAAIVDDLRARRATVCDFGCAEGEGTALLAARWGVPVTGVDAAAAAIARARARHPRVEFVHAADGLDRTYDVLFTSNTLEHFPDPWAALERLLARIRDHALVLVPFEEEPRIREHEVTFRWDGIPLAVGTFALVALEVIDCARVEGACWPGKQVLLSFSRADGPVARGARVADLARPLLARVAAAERRRDELAASLAEAEARREVLRAGLEKVRQGLLAARERRAFKLARASAVLQRDPAAAAASAARWAAGKGRHGARSLHDFLRGEDPLGDAAAALEGAASVPAPVPPDPDAEYVAALRHIEDQVRERATDLRRQHAAAIEAFDARVARSRGLVVYPPVLSWGYLRQRPQQIMAELGRRGFVCLFLPPDPAADGVDGLREVEENVFLASDVRLASHHPRPIVWITWTPNAAYASAFADPRVVYESIDHLELFHLYSAEMRRHHVRLARTADAVVASADRLLAELRSLRPDAVLAPNGVRPDDFGPARAGAVPDDLAPAIAAGRPIVGYHGALARWLDHALLNAVTAAAPDLSFVLLGPDYDGSAARIARRPNVFLLGRKSYDELPRYLRRLDAAMIPFVIDDITRATSPVKLFEAMAAGLPPVATPMDECRKYRSVAIADGPDAFLAALRAAVARRAAPACQALLAAEVAENTWAARVESILDALETV